MNDFFSLTIFLFLTNLCLGQTLEISGKITDSLDNPIGYAAIGILNKPSGTVSNLNGNFELKLDSTNESDTLKISSLGYESKELLISKIDRSKPFNIVLKSFTEPLKEISITSKKLKSYTEGKSKTNTNQQVIFANPDMPNKNLGTEIGRKFKLEDDDPSKLEKFKFYIKDNNFDSAKFRINIYTIADNKPEQKLNIPNIFASASKDYIGWIEVNLSPYNIVVNEDIIVTVEWVEHSDEGNQLNLPIIIPSFGSTHYYKFGSQNSWKKYSGLSSSMELTYKK